MKNIEKLRMPYPYTLRPRESQLKAMKDIYRTKRRLVWGVPGTGKTKIALDFAGSLLFHKKVKRVIVIAPNTALGVWEEQIEINCPWVQYQFLTKDHQPDWNADGIIITNYEYFIPRNKKKVLVKGKRKGCTVRRLDREILERILEWGPQVVAIDEGHKIKNPQTRAAKSLHKLGDICEYAIDLTGTPTGNRKRLDLWSQFRFLKPDLLPDTFSDFKKEYATWGGFGGFSFIKERNTEQFDAIVKPYITVIKKKGIEQKTFIPYRIEMPPKAKELYKKMEEEFVIEVEKSEIIAPIALAKLTKCQQISGGFIRSNEGKDLPLHRAKVDATLEILDELKESGINRCIIFARFKWEIDQLCAAIRDWTTYRITGDESPNERKQSESLFNKSGGVAICQIATGSVSLSFKYCDYGIFYSLDHSHINFTQAQYRIDRDEITKPCFYYVLLSKGTVDSKIYRTLKENRNIANEIRNLVQEIKRDRA